jgi:HAD superfamily hydrolase (TIGR01509 family)
MLISNNIAIAICSGARRHEIEQILLKGRLLKFFDLIVSADEVAAGKPDPQGFLLTLQMLATNHPGRNIEPSDCVVVEDSHWGIEAAKAAGMHTVETECYACNAR